MNEELWFQMGSTSSLLTFILLDITKVMQYTPGEEDPDEKAETRFKLKTEIAPLSTLFIYPAVLILYCKKFWKQPILPVNSSRYHKVGRV